MRLQVFLSHSGICSRRAAFDLVRSGRVRVGTKIIVEPSYSVNPQKDVVFVDGKNLSIKNKDYLLLNKPRGVVTTRKDKYAPRTVFDLLPLSFSHLYPVGRLDKESEGLVILTNDGELAFRLMHPSFEIDKQYIVRVNKRLRDEDKRRLEKGIVLDGKRTSPAKISFVNLRVHLLGASPPEAEKALKIIIHEGKKRQIRRMLIKLGYEVRSLKRIAYGPLRLEGLEAGKWRRLNEAEKKELFRCVGISN